MKELLYEMYNLASIDGEIYIEISNIQQQRRRSRYLLQQETDDDYISIIDYDVIYTDTTKDNIDEFLVTVEKAQDQQQQMIYEQVIYQVDENIDQVIDISSEQAVVYYYDVNNNEIESLRQQEQVVTHEEIQATSSSSESKKQSNDILFIIIGLIISVFILIVIIYRYFKKNKFNKNQVELSDLI